MTRLLILGIAAVALVGCGSGGRAQPRGYSMAAVRKAFSAQGVQLKRSTNPAPGVLDFVHGGIHVLVITPHGKWSWFESSDGTTRYTCRNLGVIYPVRYRPTVRAALTSLPLAPGCVAMRRAAPSPRGARAIEYAVQITKAAKEFLAAQLALQAQGAKETSVADVVLAFSDLLRTEKRIRDRVAALNPPKNAETANAALVKALGDHMSAVTAVIAKIQTMGSVEAVDSYLNETGGPNPDPVDMALLPLAELGYFPECHHGGPPPCLGH